LICQQKSNPEERIAPSRSVNASLSHERRKRSRSIQTVESMLEGSKQALWRIN
jgi:uncharacterized protein YeeX (DUF496 family)